jgi:hypothetical protein
MKEQQRQEMEGRDAYDRKQRAQQMEAIIAQRDDAKMGRIGEHQIAVKWPKGVA